MTYSLIPAAMAFALLGELALAMQPQPQPPARPPEGAANPPRAEEVQTLSAEQKSLVGKILSAYRPAALTAADAKAINEAFRAAGLRRSSGLQQAVRDAGFDPRQLSQLAPSPNQPASGGAERSEPPASRPAPPRGEAGAPAPGRYSIDQAISSRAQLNTIAFDALAFLTGDVGGNTFLPPGKVSDFFGFQYMRDIDSGELGHNTSFVPLVANNVLYILNAQQKAQLTALAAEQEALLREFALKRFPLVWAFRRLLDGDLPAGKRALDSNAVANYTAGLFELDGQLSYRRAAVLGGIIAHLDSRQKAYLAKMLFNDSRTWPKQPDQVDKRSLPPDRHVAVMTYASELFSWYAGSVDADVYFCPERHATYFGSFYMKDIPAMGNPGYSISTRLTGDSGEAFLALLTAPQRSLITGLVDLQRGPLNEIVQTRRAIALELRRFLKGETPDRQAVLSLFRQYGRLDGVISCHYATRFAEVGRTLTQEQRRMLAKLRNLDGYSAQGAFLYSRAIPMPGKENTDFLFGAGRVGESRH